MTQLLTRLSPQLLGREVLVGVSGSVAAYRACDVVRRLREMNASVRVATTKAARAFVTDLTFEALSGQPVLGDVLHVEHGRIPHIEMAYRAHAVVVAPASADLLAKMAHGQADEALLATLLSFRGPVLVAPAMETRMWEHEATQHNVRTLQERGVLIVGPDDGALASGRSGRGRLASVDAIVEHVVRALAPQDFVGRRVLVTAGGTVEDVDPVRYLSNRSSGKMGVALARQAALRGAQVDLVHAPLKIALPLTPGIVTHAVRSAADMHARVEELSNHVDAVLMCAAVADARPTTTSARKLKKTEDALTAIALSPTVDILASLGARSERRFVLVGFAAETHDVERSARDKLVRKHCDLVCGNDVSEPGSGFDTDTNRLFLASAESGTWLPRTSKDEAAGHVLDAVLALFTRAV